MAVMDAPLPRAQATSRWDKNKGLISWLTTVDHKKLGILYLYTTFFFFLIGGIMALLVRVQLAEPQNKFLTPAQYNQIFTMHGTTMIFLWIIPVFAGFGNYIVPLMIGARDMAFPRINALSYWLIPLGGLTMYAGFLFGGTGQAGWTGYVPLTERQYSPQVGQDLWILGLHTLGLSSMLGGVNFLTTLHNMRAKGLTWFRLPLFCWAQEVTQALVVLASPFLAGVLLMVLLDRQAGASFFAVNHGGSALLYQLMFWFYSHPAVYIMILPGMGIVSEIVTAFARKKVFGYKFIAWSSIAIAVIGFFVWGHHMFVAGQSLYASLVFSILSFLVAVPSAIKVFNWLGTLHKGTIRFDAPMLYALGFIGLFTIGGLTGL
ncbi:MAG: Cytochrome c oxidase subunit type, partial [Chloroflexi bacterium]|nr:Cytochrome c oxidase subunit type [Chloroflexota bacterium]